jgi:hypothetical protein
VRLGKCMLKWKPGDDKHPAQFWVEGDMTSAAAETLAVEAEQDFDVL